MQADDVQRRKPRVVRCCLKDGKIKYHLQFIRQYVHCSRKETSFTVFVFKEIIDWPCYIAPATFIIAAIFVMTVSVLVSFLFSRRIKRINMVEVLKGME